MPATGIRVHKGSQAHFMHEGTPGERLARGTRVRVTLKKARPPDIEYPAVVIADDGSHLVVEASWSEDAERDLGFVRFEPGLGGLVLRRGERTGCCRRVVSRLIWSGSGPHDLVCGLRSGAAV